MSQLLRMLYWLTNKILTIGECMTAEKCITSVYNSTTHPTEIYHKLMVKLYNT